MNIEIVNLNQIKYEDWLILWKAYLEFYQSNSNKNQAELTWKRLTDDQNTDMFGFATLINNQILGFVHLIAHQSTWTERPYCYLQDLFVDANHRNQGHAKRLIEHCYVYAADKFDRVYWLTHESNVTAQCLYDRIACKTGFIQYRKSLI